MMPRQNTRLAVDEIREAGLKDHGELLKGLPDLAGFLPVDEEAVQKLGERAATETILPPERADHQVLYPVWPTSQPGPWATLPEVSQKPVRTRTDQMTDACYDQERGRPCVVLPQQATREKEGKKYKRQVSPPHAAQPVRPAETLQAASMSHEEEAQAKAMRPLRDQLVLEQQVYDAPGTLIGKIMARFPRYVLVERGRILPRVYYVPLALIERSEERGIRLMVSEATLKEQGFAHVPDDLHDASEWSDMQAIRDISGVLQLGKYPLTPAEMGHYHYGPYWPGINTDASGSYAPSEIDPRGRAVDRPVKLYVTQKPVQRRST